MVRHVGLLPYCCRKYARQSLLELLGRAQLTLITKQTGKCHACNIYAAGVGIPLSLLILASLIVQQVSSFWLALRLGVLLQCGACTHD